MTEQIKRGPGRPRKDGQITAATPVRNIVDISKELPQQANAFSQIEIEPLNIIRQSIRDWNNAYESAKDHELRNRTELLLLYEAIEIDSHVFSLVNTVFTSISQMPFNIVEKGGEINEEKTELFKKSWFNDFLAIILDASYWGFSAIQFGDIVDDSFAWIKSIPKHHIRPDFRVKDTDGLPIWKPGITERYSDEVPVFFFDEKPWDKVAMLIYPQGIADPFQLGLYNKIAKLFIIKRDVLQFWAIYNELFGVPRTIIKTDMNNNLLKNNAIKAANSLKTASSLILDLSDIIEPFDTNSQGNSAGGEGGTFITILTWIDQQMSKAFLGSTMVVDDGSSRSQAEVHDANTQKFIRQRAIWSRNVINEKLVPRMIESGFPLIKGDKFVFDDSEKLTTEQQAGVIDLLNRSYHVPVEFVQEKLGIPVEEKEEVQLPSEPQGDKKEAKKDAKNISLADRMQAMYKTILRQ